MSVTNSQSRTNVHEIAAGIYRISTPVDAIPGGFTFNQILVVDDEPLLFHTGLRQLFPFVKEAVEHVLGDVAKLRYVGFSHFESDECGSLNQWLAVAPRAEPVCSKIAAMVSVNDFADRPPRALADGQELSLGKKSLRWLDAPHVPHNWECGYLFETTTRTLLCGDLSGVDLLVHRLAGFDLSNAKRVNVTLRVETTEQVLAEIPNAPFDAREGVLIACQRHYAHLPPDIVFEVSALDASGAERSARYTILHVYPA